MPLGRVAVMLLCLTLLPVSSAPAQSPAFKEAFDNYQSLNDQGRYADAEPLYHRGTAVDVDAI